MSNFNDIIKKAHNLGILLDGCGKDERYYTFGSYVDLCGASPKELMPKCCCCDNTSGDTGIVDNIITINITYDNTWKIKMHSESPVTSNISAIVSYEYIDFDGIIVPKEETFIINANSSDNTFNLTVPNDVQKINIKNVELSPSNDNNYDYIVVYETEYKLYYGVTPIAQTNDIDETIIKTFDSLICNDNNDLSFSIPAIGIEGIDDIENEDEVNDILRKNAYDLIIAYDANIENYEITDLFGNNDEKFSYFKDITIDNKAYKVLVRNDPDTQRNVYDTNSGPIPFAPITYSFNIK